MEEAEEMAPAQRPRLDVLKRTTQRGDGTEPTVIHRNSVRACMCVSVHVRVRVCLCDSVKLNGHINCDKRVQS